MEGFGFVGEADAAAKAKSGRRRATGVFSQSFTIPQPVLVRRRDGAILNARHYSAHSDSSEGGRTRAPSITNRRVLRQR